MLWPFSRFARTEQKSLADPEDWLMGLFGSSPVTASGAVMTIQAALAVPAVSAAVKTISEAAATLDVQIVEIDAAGIETPVADHPALTLLRDDANDWTSGYELIRDLVADALCRDAGGLAWVNWVNDKPTEIIRYRPGVIAVDLTLETGQPVYRFGARVLPGREVIHVRSPFDRAPLTLAREAIGVAAVMELHAARLFGKGARPGGVIETAKNVGDEGVKKMIAGWRAAMEGAENAGKTAVLWDGATWRQMTLSSVDAQFQELRLFQIQEIARAFNIPAPMLGDLSRATWSNSEQKGREFLSYCLEPWLRAVEGTLRRALFMPEERKRLAVRFDRDDLTRADLAVRASAISSLITSRTLNPNEARSWIGLPPRDGGDEYANPNTGASQPGVATPSDNPEPKPAEVDSGLQ